MTRKRKILTLATSLTLFLSIYITYWLTLPPNWLIYNNYYYRFLYLDLTKKLVAQQTVNGNKVYIYSDRFDGRLVKLFGDVYIYPIVKESYDDFEKFVTKNHGLKMPHKTKISPLVITFVSSPVYDNRRLSDIRERDTSNAFTNIAKKGIYIEGMDGEFDFGKFDFAKSKNKSTLRHEIFHFLSLEYGLYEFLPHSDAEKFADLENPAS